MRIKLILPALAEAQGQFWRPIKYSLFPPLGLATLAGYLRDDDDVSLVDEHVEPVPLDDEPDLVGIEVYVTSAHRAYRIADAYRVRGIHVVLGGLHVTAMPREAMQHADTVVIGPAEEAWPRFIEDFRTGRARRVYRSRKRTLANLPPIRRDLIRRRNYLVPNSLVVSRGCRHNCDFCYKHSFYRGGASYYRYSVEQALREIDSLPGRHLFFLDDNLLGDRPFALALFSEMKGMNRVWQGAGTVQALQDEALVQAAAESGLRSLFVGFETLNQGSLNRANKRHNRIDEYEAAIRRLHDHGVMINASFVFGLDEDGADVFERTVEWAVENSLETATFHLLTPYPGTRLYAQLAAAGRILTTDWDLYDTRHAVFQHPSITTEQLEAGYRRAYHRFYEWNSIFRSAAVKPSILAGVRHAVYTGAWKKCEWLWAFVIRAKKLPWTTPILEWTLEGRWPGQRLAKLLLGRCKSSRTQEAE